MIKLGENILVESKIELFQRFLEEIMLKLKEISENNFKEDWIIIIFTAFPSAISETAIEWNPTEKNFTSTFKIMIHRAIQLVCEKH